MLVISNLEKSYGSRTLFKDLSININEGERVGLVGRNGHGKSTLLKIILGEEEYDSGDISYPKHFKIGYLSQHLVFTEKNILDEVCTSLPLLDGTWKETYKAEEMLEALGFSKEDFTRSPSEFSGGYQIRLNLAKLLLSEPDLLLLDEPTNYLDIVSIRWLRNFLNSFSGAVLLITHDRSFMDSVTTHTAAIHRQALKKVEGQTSKLYSLIAEEEEIYEKTRAGEEKKIKQTKEYIDRFRAKASKAKSVQSKIKALDKMEIKEALSEIDSLDFNFSYEEFPGKWQAIIKDLSFGYNKDKPLFKDLSLSIKKGDRIAVIGPNGKGKSTLLNIISGMLKPDRGSVDLNTHTKLEYFGQTNVERLSQSKTIEDEIWSVSPSQSRSIVRAVCGAMMFEGDAALKKIGVLSGGEKSRVLLGKILLSPCNMLLLDEPTNHLDMQSIDALTEAIKEFSGAVIIVTHSEELIEKIADKLIIFDHDKAEVFLGKYSEFLEKKGWRDEVQPSYVQKTQKKDDEKKLKKLEKKIEKKEKEIEKIQAKMEELSGKGEIDKLLEETSKMDNAQKELEELYQLLV